MLSLQSRTIIISVYRLRNIVEKHANFFNERITLKLKMYVTCNQVFISHTFYVATDFEIVLLFCK